MGMPLYLMLWNLISRLCFWFRPVLTNFTLSSIVMVIERKCIKRAFKLCWLLKSRAWTSASWVRDIMLFDALIHDSQMFRNVRCYLRLNHSQKTFSLECIVKIQHIALCCALQLLFCLFLFKGLKTIIFRHIHVSTYLCFLKQVWISDASTFIKPN